MGQVFLAQDTDLDRQVALKFLPPSPANVTESQVRLLQEARLAASFNHPYICTVYEIGETDEGGRFIAMENVPGETLEQRLERGALDWREARELIWKIARGLAHAHEADIIHRDIKPSNIMITPDGDPRILDFGLARLTADPHLTRTGTLLGTMAYLSPEQLQGEDPDRQADIWALGVVFYQMLTGVLPFKGDFDAALVYAISHSEIPDLAVYCPGLPAILQKIMDRLLARDKAARYDSLEDFLADLETIEGGGSLSRPGFRIPRTAGWAALVLAGLLIVWGGLKLAGKGPGTAAAPMSIAVLPLDNLSGNPDQDYFATGFTGELIANLTRVRGLRVMARGSVLGFEDSDLTVAEIADKLGVRRVVTGTIQELDDKLQVSVEVIDTEKGFAVWADSFKGPSDEVLQLQGTMAGSIVEALRGEVTVGEAKAFSGAPKVDPEAYRLYLKGLALEDTWGVDSIWKEAVRYYRQATDLEPGFAPAYAGLSRMYNYLAWFNTEMDYNAMAKTAAEKALAIDPELPAGQAALAFYLFLFENKWAEAERMFEAALQTDPGNTIVLADYGVMLQLEARCDEALRIMRKTADLDPLNFAPSRDLAATLCNCREFEACIDLTRELAVRFEGETTHLLYFRAYALVGLGRLDEALAEIRQHSPVPRTFAPILWLGGEREKAWQMVGGKSGSDPETGYLRMVMLTLEGKYGQALDLLEAGLENRPALTKFVLTEFLLEPLYDQPRFKRIMASINMPGY